MDAGKMDELEKEAQRVMEIHGIGASKAPVQPAAAELFEAFKCRKETTSVGLGVENHFYSGFQHSQVDWSRPVHGILVDFKGDSMQIGMLLERLELCQEQYIFIGAPPPFNGGWHFTALNDFEHVAEQKGLDPGWEGFRIWHRVNYVPSSTEEGMPALVPREQFDPKSKHAGSIPIGDKFKLATIFLTGGLMPHTLNATLMADNGDAAQVVKKHVELGTRFATIGHGLDVILAIGEERSIFSGFQAAVFPKQEHLLAINGLVPPADGAKVCSFASKGVELVSASYWGKDTAEPFFAAVGLAAGMDSSFSSSGRVQRLGSSETAFCFDASKLDGMSGSLLGGDASAPRVAFLVDDVADPIEAYTIVDHLVNVKFNVHLISRSATETGASIRQVQSETVWGNAMYALKDCCCLLPTTPANLVDKSIQFDGVFVAGGQCPYYMMQDPAVTAILDSALFAAAVCHGPEALIGSKWLHPPDGKVGPFISYYGAWMSFRDVHGYERRKPGEICEDASSRLFTGNAPNSTKALVIRACEAISASKA